MATELAKAYVQIIPSAQGITGKIQEAIDPEAEPAGTSFGGKMVGTLKKVIATAAIGEALKKTISEGADLEQSIGGIETLFKESADKVKANAAEAYKTAGMSANEYMELTTSFSASLLSSLSNDTSKAADVADMAMTDMSDNANKMGTNMEDIKNAYQGFAKQNYTMLDNLKLGYGGTKTEMERLLKDAQKISGVKYDINNLSDVYSAIHVIQGELDITGTTAKEAATTISGSMNSMKAAAKNVMGQIALGKDIGPALSALGETTITFFAGNLLPAVANVLSGLPDLISGVTSVIVRSMNMAASNMDSIVSRGGQIILNLASSILENAPFLLEAVLKLAMSLGETLINTDWGAVGRSVMDALSGSIDSAAGEILGIEGGEILTYLADALEQKLPVLMIKGSNILMSIINGIIQKIPNIITTAGTIITNFVNAIFSLLPNVLNLGGQLLANFVNGITQQIPFVVETAGTMITNYIDVISSLLPQIVQSGIKLILNFANGITQKLPSIVEMAGTMITNYINAISSLLPQIIQSGVQLVLNFISGIVQKLPYIIGMGGTVVTNYINAISSLLPQIIQSGVQLILNFVNGIIQKLPAMVETAGKIVTNFASGVLNNLPQIISAAIQMVTKIVITIGQNLPQILQSGVMIVGKLAAGLIRAIPTLIGQIPQIIESIKNTFLNVDWGSIGHNIIQGITNGLKSAGHMLWEAVKGILGNFKDNVLAFFGIHSPSRWGVFVGEMIDAGFAKGIIGELPTVNSAVTKLQDIATSPFSNASLNYELQGAAKTSGTGQETADRLDTLIALLKMILAIIGDKDDDNPSERELIRALRDLGVVFT